MYNVLLLLSFIIFYIVSTYISHRDSSEIIRFYKLLESVYKLFLSNLYDLELRIFIRSQYHGATARLSKWYPIFFCRSL